MKTKLLLLIALCLFIFSVASHAQQAPPNFAQMRNSPVMQQAMKNGMKNGIRSFWDGRGANLMAFGFMQDPNIRAAWGVSDEHYQEIQGIPMRIGTEMQNNPEFQKIAAEMQALGGPQALFGQNVDEETQKKLQDVQGRMMTLSMDLMSEAINNVVTPEQKHKMNVSLLANMAEMPFASPRMYEALDLTDAQRQQMEAIKKELEPEFEQHLENFANGSMLLANKLFEELEKQGVDNFESMVREAQEGQKDPQAMQEKMRAMQEKILGVQKKLMENPEYKKIAEEVQSKGMQFTTQFNAKIFDVLTDDQWNRLQNLIDNPPEYAKAVGKKLKEQKGASEKAGAWQPGPNSWKPGDPIPESYRQERNERSRFSRENQRDQ